jgi:ABC-type spermidine/putrescine transport system permease subunit II
LVVGHLNRPDVCLSGAFLNGCHWQLDEWFITEFGRVLIKVDDYLGLSQMGVVQKLHFPLIRGSVLTALLVCFVDILKELPATLILRPFDFNTLAVKAYELAGDERLIDAAVPSLCIVLVGLLPVIWLNRSVTRE